MQRACAISSSVACPVVPYFSTLSHKRHHFRKKLSNIKCVFFFYFLCNLCVKYFSFYEELRERDDQKCILVLTKITLYSCLVFILVWF